MRKAFFILIISLTVLGCGNEETNNHLENNHIYTDKVDYIIFGYHCGECANNCATMWKIDSQGVYKDTTDSFFGREGPFVFSGFKLDNSKFQKVKEVIPQIPKDLILSKDSVFGKPDNHDQCGLYIQIKTKDRIGNWDIDPDSIPEFAKLFVSQIDVLITKLEND